MTPLVNVTGEFYSTQERSFTDSENKVVNFYQVTILTDDTYRPLMSFTVDKDVLDEAGLLPEKASVHRGEKVALQGHLSFNSREVNGTRVQMLRIKIDESIEFID